MFKTSGFALKHPVLLPLLLLLSPKLFLLILIIWNLCHLNFFSCLLPGQFLGSLLRKPNVLLHRYICMERAIVFDDFHLWIHCPSELYCHHDLQLTGYHCTQSEKHEDSNKFGFAGDGHNGFAHDRLSISMVSNFQTLYFFFQTRSLKWLVFR